MPPSLITIVGPTATGKTDLSIALAQQLSGEIVSADSRQIYRGFDIGSGKVSLSEMHNIPHHMLDIRDVWQGYSVAEFQKEATQHIQEISQRNNIPFLVGGTGLYIDAVIQGYQIPEIPPNPHLRKKLEQKTLTELQQMHQLVAKGESLNPSDSQNPVRLIRKIEQAMSGSPLPSKKTEPLWNNCIIGLTASPTTLRTQISKRVQQRLELGAIEEVHHLLETLTQHMSVPAAHKKLITFGLGTVAIFDYLQGTISYESLQKQYITKEYQYAKRQLTWFKRNPEIHWIDIEKEPVVEESIQQIKYTFSL